MITGLYAALLAIWLCVLSMRVIALRGSPVFAFLGTANPTEDMLNRSIRAQGNLTEYAPTMLILLLLLEQGGASGAPLHGLGGSFLLGRLAHGFCFAFMEKSAPLRIGGTALTLVAILTAAVTLLL